MISLKLVFFPIPRERCHANQFLSVLYTELIFVTPVASGAAGWANAGLCPASSSLFFCRVLLQYIKLLMLQIRICAIVNVLSYRIASCQPFMLAGLRLSLQPMRLFLPTRRYASAGTSYGPVFVRLSVSLSQVGVLSKRLDRLS